jgi:AcrR family transcriptional regulator
VNHTDKVHAEIIERFAKRAHELYRRFVADRSATAASDLRQIWPTIAGNDARLPPIRGIYRAAPPLSDFAPEQAERYGHVNRALPADELTPCVENPAQRIASFPAHAIAHAKAAVDTAAFTCLAEGSLVEAHGSDLSVASEVTQARVKEALKVGGETYEGELEMHHLSRLSPTR